MFAKIAAVLEVMKYGQEVADPAKWKSRQVNANVIAGLLTALVALAQLYGISIPFNEDIAYGLATGGLAVFNAIMTMVTSKKAGFGKTESE